MNLSQKNIWNLPVKKFPDRASVFWDIIVAHFGSKPIDILEIGVFKATLLKGALARNDLKIKSYTGIDPYVGDKSDSYFGSYWKAPSEASDVFEVASKIFDQPHCKLKRTFSRDFFRELSSEATYDLIIIDGDHRYHYALWDLHHWFKKLRPNGLLIADDYANSDTPDVTKAINRFIEMNEMNIKRRGYERLEFQNVGKQIPISLTFVYFQTTVSVPQIATVDFETPNSAEKLKPRSFVQSLIKKLLN
jgi:hypothetical protein